MLVSAGLTQLLQSVHRALAVLFAFVLRVAACPWRTAEQHAASLPCQATEGQACSSLSVEASSAVQACSLCMPRAGSVAVATAADSCGDLSTKQHVKHADKDVVSSSMAAAQAMHLRAAKGKPRRPYESPLGDVLPITVKVLDLEPEELPPDALMKLQDCIDDATTRAGQPCWTLRVSVRRGCVLITIDAVPAVLQPTTSISSHEAAMAAQAYAAPVALPSATSGLVFQADRSDSLASGSGPGPESSSAIQGTSAPCQSQSTALQLAQTMLPQLMERLQARGGQQQLTAAAQPTLVFFQLHGQQVKATLQPGKTNWTLELVSPPTATSQIGAAWQLPASPLSERPVVSGTAVAQLGVAMQCSPVYWRQCLEQELQALGGLKKSSGHNEQHVIRRPKDAPAIGGQCLLSAVRQQDALLAALSGTMAVQLKLQIWVKSAPQHMVDHSQKVVVQGSDGVAGNGPPGHTTASLKDKLSSVAVSKVTDSERVEIAAGWARAQATASACTTPSGCMELQLWAQGGSGYLPVKVLQQHATQVTEPGRLLEVTVEMRLDSASLVCHHTDDYPALLQPVYLQLFSADMLLNSTYTLLRLPFPSEIMSQPGTDSTTAVPVPPPGNLAAGQVHAAFGWWGVDADTALAAGSELQAMTQQVWALASEDANQHTSHMLLLRDICYWLSSVQHAWQQHGWCVSAPYQPHSSNYCGSGKPSLPPAYRLALGSDLVRYALQANLPKLHKLLHEQWWHMASASSSSSSSTQLPQTGAVMRESCNGTTGHMLPPLRMGLKDMAQRTLATVLPHARAAVLGYRCRACEQQYHRRLRVSFAQACSVISCILGVCGVLMLVRQPNVGSDPMAWLVGIWGMLHTCLFVLSLTAHKNWLLTWLPLAAYGMRVLMCGLVTFKVLNMMESVQKQHDTNTWVVSYSLSVLSDRLYILSRLPRPVITLLTLLETKVVFMQARTQQHSFMNSLVGSIISVMLVPWFIDANARGWLIGSSQLQHGNHSQSWLKNSSAHVSSVEGVHSVSRSSRPQASGGPAGDKKVL